MSDSIQVAIKVRPLIKREKDENLPFQWTVADNVIVPVDPEKKRGEGGFQFDHIFDPEKSNQDVFETVVQPIIDAAVKGFNGTVFAYGQTSSGKTHTMLGTPIEPGIIPLAVNRTFDSIAETENREFLLRVSYLEIYNEKVNDLLDPSAVDLKLREDTNGLVQVLKCKEEIASTPEIIMTIMKKGDKNRRIGETDMNERSSRSHTIFRITIESRNVSSDSDGAIQVSQLNLVDLAGSERARQTNATGERFKEGTHINLSLSSLGLVIKQLSEASENSKQHVNFRDSKLTRLLQASLGGNAMTTIICAVTPAAFDETLCTLSFASRAKSVKNKPQLNEVMSDATLLKRYKRQMAKLNQELERLKNEKGFAEVQEMESKLQEKEHKLQETDRLNQILEERIELLKNSIISARRASKEDNILKIPRCRRRFTWGGDGRNFQLSPCGLEPIKEDASPEKINKLNEKFVRVPSRSRKSIIQTVDLEEESFETAFADFELELIKVTKEREEETNEIVESGDEKGFYIAKPKLLNRVKFQDDVEIFSLSNHSDFVTPDKPKTNSDESDKSPSSSSPGTPKKVLRERLSYITQEYNSLQEFTTLERQTLFAQKEDFSSSNEKIFMQNQIDGLMDRLMKSNVQQDEVQGHLSLSCKCIEDFCSLTPGISEQMLTGSFFNDEQKKVDMSKLLDLQELLKNLKNERNSVEKSMTPLEKKLTDDYNQCLQELEQIKIEKGALLEENTQIKNQLSSQFSKLKNTESLVNTLQVDTDCLMEKLIQKNSELAELKEKVVELEKTSRIEQENSASISMHESSMLKDKSDISIKGNVTSGFDEDPDTSKLKEIVEEKTSECEKYRKFEEELKAENELLQQALEDINMKNSKSEESLKAEISELSEMIEIRNKKILEHQQLEVELKLKIEQLDQNFTAAGNTEKISLVCQSENSDKNVLGNSSAMDIDEEIVENCKDGNINESDPSFSVNKKVQSVTQQCQTESVQVKLMSQEIQTDNIESRRSLSVVQNTWQEKLELNDSNRIRYLEEQITKLKTVIQEQSCEIEKRVKTEKELKEETENLLTDQSDSKLNTEHFSKERPTDTISDLEINKKNREEIFKLSAMIQEKETEITTLKQFEEKMKEGIAHLKTCLFDVLKTENTSGEMEIDEDLAYDNEKIESELKTSDKEKLYQEEIESLVTNIKKLVSLNYDLKNCINEKDNKILDSKKVFEIKIQELEENINSIALERNQLKEEIAFTRATLAQDFEKEVSKLKEMVEKLQKENDALNQKLKTFQTEFDASDLSNSLQQELVASTSIKTEVLENIINDQVKNTINNLNDSKQLTNDSQSNVKEHPENLETMLNEKDQSIYKAHDRENDISTVDNFVKPTNASIQNSKDFRNANVSHVESTQTNSTKEESTQPALNKLELESSSIFANQTYFDNMETGQSFVEGWTGLITGLDESKDVTNTINVNSDTLLSYNTSVKLEVVNDLSTELKNVQSVKVEDVKPVTPTKINEPFTVEGLEKIKAVLEKKNEKLTFDLENKVHELEEIQKNFKDFKQNLEELQKTIFVLTNENSDMSNQLTKERENNKKFVDALQAEIESLTTRLTKISEERTSLKNELLILNEQLDSARASTPLISDDDLRKKYSDLQEKVKNLNEENITLSTELMEKIEELEKIKESKVQMFDHQCTYSQKVPLLVEEKNNLEKENIMLSDDVTRHIEECDKLKETIEVMKQQLEAYGNLKSSENSNKDELELLKNENIRLSNELIELRAKNIQLNRENTNLSYNMHLDLNDESNSTENVLLNRSSNEASTTLETLFSNSSYIDENNVTVLKEKVKSLQEQVNNLILANQKLTDIKIPMCTQCSHMKELNQNRRQLKNEINSLNRKHADLQKQFEQKCADVEKLKEKANESFNSTLNSTLNSSFPDGFNVTFMEEKVQNLHSEFEELKENHNKLSNQYQDKCNELERLQIENSIPSATSKKDAKRSKSDTPRKNSQRLKSLEKDLENLATDLKELKNDYTNVSSSLIKFIEEKGESQNQIELLKSSSEQIHKEYSEKLKLVEDELAFVYAQLNTVKSSENEIRAQKLEVDVQLESLLKEKSDLLNSLQNNEKLENSLRGLKEENSNLKNDLQKLEEIVKSDKNDNNYLEQKLQDEIDFAKSRIIKEIRGLASLPEEEIKDMPKKQVADLFSSFLNAIMSKEREFMKDLNAKFEKIKRKLEEEKQQVIDELKRANNWAKTLEIDLEKHQVDLSESEREKQHLRNEINRYKESLKESQYEKQQLHSHISTLEVDINSLHAELDKKSKNNIEQDFVDNIVAQEKEKIARAKDEEWEKSLKLEREKNCQVLKKLNQELESCQSSNEDFRNTIEGLDLEITHLKSTIDIKSNDLVESTRKKEELEQEIEHLEEIIQQLKNECSEKERRYDEINNLLKVKCDLLQEYKTKVETLKPECESKETQLTERKQMIEKYKEEIHIMKLENKKQADMLQDKLSSEEMKSAALSKQLNEYKNKNTALSCTLEEIKDRCSELEREKEHLQRKIRNSTSKLRVENEKQELQDENITLKKDLEGSYNRISALIQSKSQIERELLEAQGKSQSLEQELTTTQMTLNSLREKYNNFNVQKLREKYESVLIEKNNLVREIEAKKMLIAEKDQKLIECSIEIDTLKKQNEDLHDKIKAFNNEKFLLDSQVSCLLNDCENLKQQMEIINSEKENIYKSNVEEKSQILNELEECKKEKSEIEAKNTELDKEMDEMVDHIHQQENEIAELRDKLITGSYHGNYLEKLKTLEDNNEQLRIDLRVTEVHRDKLQEEIVKLRSDKEALYRRIEDLNSRIGELESRNSSRSSSKTNSPTTHKERRRRRRSDLYCQNRNLDENDSKEFTDVDSPSTTPTPPLMELKQECQTCFDLRSEIKKMSLDLVSSNKKITLLEVQLQSENFPYQTKCNELNQKLIAVSTKNSELTFENQKLQRALMDDSFRDCHVCRQRKLNKRDQSIQTNIPNKISLTGMSSGIVEDHLRLEKMEKERNWMKELCRNRARKVKELEQRVMELESLKTS